jgi:hypothetical protein
VQDHLDAAFTSAREISGNTISKQMITPILPSGVSTIGKCSMPFFAT